MKKIFWLFLFLFLFIFFLSTDVYAAPSAPSAPKLEVEYPALPKAPPPVPGSPFSVFARYFLVFMISISGIIALFVLTFAGFQYITSTGNSQKIEEAKDKIKYGLLGLLIVLSFFIVLNTINPDFINKFGIMPPLDVFLTEMVPGVYLCTEAVDIPRAYEIQKLKKGTKQLKDENNAIMKQVEEKCYQLGSSSSQLSKEYNDKIKIIYLVPAPELDLYYGVILYEKTDFQGHAAMAYVLRKENKAIPWPLSNSFRDKVSSAIPFLLNFQPYPTSYVTIYQDIDWNRKILEKVKNGQITEAEARGMEQTIYSNQFWSPSIAPHITLKPPQKAKAKWPQIGSLKIEPPNNYIVVFFPNDAPGWDDTTIIDVYLSEDNDLNGNKMGGAGPDRWNPECMREVLYNEGTSDEAKKWIQYPCAGAMVIVSASTF